MPDSSVIDAVDDCFERLAATFASERAQRLAEADVTACLRSRGTSEALTLLFDRTPPAVVHGCTSAEVELELSPAHFAALAAGRLELQALVMRGEISYHGPVRKLLSVSAVLMSLLTSRGAPARDTAKQIPADPTAAARFREQERGDFWAIECVNLHKRFEGSAVLAGVNLGVPEGLITVLLGPSGTGKSVLLKHLTGLLRPDAGEVVVRGRPLGQLSLKELLALRRQIGILFQDGALWGSMNLYDNVALPLRQHTDLSEDQIGTVVREQLENVGLAEAETKMPNELSGGMRKRAGFARALVLDPGIVLFDEPDSGLDPVRTALLCDLIARIHSERGGTYLIITHDIGTARQVADYIAVLWQGAVVEAGPRDEILNSSNPFVRQFLSAATEGPLGMG